MAVRRRKDGRYVVEFEQAGRRVFRRCPPGVGKADAAEYENQLRRAAFRQDKLGESPVILLAAAIELWLKETSAHKRDQRKPRQNASLLAPYVADKLLQRAPDAAQEAVTAWGATLTPATINRRLAVLKAVCKHAWRRGLIEVNLSGRIPFLPEPEGREVYLSKAQIVKLARAAPNPETTAAIMILAYSGLRWSEFAALPALARRAKSFPVPVSKTRKPRLVPVVDTVRPYLSALPFPVSYRRFVGWFWEARAKAGMPQVRIHDLRHTTASLLAEKGVPLNVIADILGDSMLTAKRYTHLLQRTKIEAMRRIG